MNSTTQRVFVKNGAKTTLTGRIWENEERPLVARRLLRVKADWHRTGGEKPVSAGKPNFLLRKAFSKRFFPMDF